MDANSKRKEELKINGHLVRCDNCGNFASWKGSVSVGWIGCSPCITGEAESFDPSDLIPDDFLNGFLNEFNKIQCQRCNDNGCPECEHKIKYNTKG